MKFKNLLKQCGVSEENCRKSSCVCRGIYVENVVNQMGVIANNTDDEYVKNGINDIFLILIDKIKGD